jgi:hypothetical protein
VPRHIAAAKIAVASPPDIQFVNKRIGWMSAPLAFDRQELSKGHHHWEFDWTTNGGRTWHDATAPSCRSVCYDGSLSFLDARHGYLFAAVRGAHAPNKLFRTSDGGRTWQLVSQPSIWGPITFANKHVAFAGGPGQMVVGDLTPGPPIITLYRTTDGGRTWSKYNVAGSKSFVELPIHVVGSHVALVQNGPNHDGGLNLSATRPPRIVTARTGTARLGQRSGMTPDLPRCPGRSGPSWPGRRIESPPRDRRSHLVTSSLR